MEGYRSIYSQCHIDDDHSENTSAACIVELSQKKV